MFIVCNPASGSREASRLLAEEVLPLLSKEGVVRYETSCRGDGVRIGREIRSHTDDADVVVLGGDGTTHELLNGFYHAGSSGTLRLAIVPTGTANALYASMYHEEQGKLASFKSLLQGKQDHLIPLTLTKNETISEQGEKTTTLTHLITSHALHAAILHDSDTDEMRRQYPGIEMFKVAAQINSINWVAGEVKLLGDRISRYDSTGKAFVQLADRTLKGPFLYLAALTTDRLEPRFVPAPYSSTLFDGGRPDLQRKPDAIDLVVIRPTRDPNVSDQGPWSQEDRIHFAKTKLVEITEKMYNEGAHLDLTYPSTGKPIVEYIRCSGYQFAPDQQDEKALLTCLDGTVVRSTMTRATILNDEQGHGKTFIWK